jgi:hypothetical protein
MQTYLGRTAMDDVTLRIRTILNAAFSLSFNSLCLLEEGLKRGQSPSSFTGFSFAQACSAAGRRVVASRGRSVAECAEGVQAEGVKRASVAEHCVFAGSHFLDVARVGGLDLLCRSAAWAIIHRCDRAHVAYFLSEGTTAKNQPMQAISME